MSLQPAPYPSVFVADLIGIYARAERRSQDILERRPGLKEFLDSGVVFSIGTIGKHQAIVLVEQQKCFRQPLHRLGQSLLRDPSTLFALYKIGDVVSGSAISDEFTVLSKDGLATGSDVADRAILAP